MDAIECGIVKLPRVPVADNLPEAEVPIYRDLWEHIGKDMPKKGAGKVGRTRSALDPRPSCRPRSTRSTTTTPRSTTRGRSAGIKMPPVFIVVCNNTSTSKLVYEWISGLRARQGGRRASPRALGSLELFRNYDEHGDPPAAPQHAADRQRAARIRRGPRRRFPRHGRRRRSSSSSARC